MKDGGLTGLVVVIIRTSEKKNIYETSNTCYAHTGVQSVSKVQFHPDSLISFKYKDSSYESHCGQDSRRGF